MMRKNLEKYKAIWAKIEDIKNIELNTLPVYDAKYIKTKIRIYDDKVCIKFHGLKVAEDYRELEFFTFISIDSLLVLDSNYIQTIVLKKL